MEKGCLLAFAASDGLTQPSLSEIFIDISVFIQGSCEIDQDHGYNVLKRGTCIILLSPWFLSRLSLGNHLSRFDELSKVLKSVNEVG